MRHLDQGMDRRLSMVGVLDGCVWGSEQRMVRRVFWRGAQGALGGENRAGCGGGDHGLNEDRTFRLQFGANRAINASFVACG